jgi:hypothetical protein
MTVTRLPPLSDTAVKLTTGHRVTVIFVNIDRYTTSERERENVYEHDLYTRSHDHTITLPLSQSHYHIRQH